MEKEQFEQIIQFLMKGEVRNALDALASFGAAHPEMAVGGLMEGMEDDYNRMLDYWKQGFKDPMLEDFYLKLTQKLYVLTANIATRYRMAHEPVFNRMHKRVRTATHSWQMKALAEQMENFVADVAMLELEPEPGRSTKREEIYKRQYRLRNDLFDYIWTSRQWQDAVADNFVDLLLSPTVDIIDQQMIVSAITLNAMEYFDFNKWRILVEVFLRNRDEAVRQRALVGWVMTVPSGMERIYPEMERRVEQMMADDGIRNEVKELQMQLIFCELAEGDNKTIRESIMPNLVKYNKMMKNSPLFLREEDDALEEMLNPLAEEESMEKLEESFSRMREMDMSGSDVFFGGFAVIKHFPFFAAPSNWFAPFDVHHPELTQLELYRKNPGMLKMLSTGMLCDSDSYSMAFAVQSMAQRMPKETLDMMGSVGARELQVFDNFWGPAYFRRQYLRNVYRFYRLNNNRDIVNNPFMDRARRPLANREEASEDAPAWLFVVKSLFASETLVPQYASVLALLLKKRLYDIAERVAQLPYGHEDYNMMMRRGQLYLRLWQTGATDRSRPSEAFRKALALCPDDGQALRGLAKAMMVERDFQQAWHLYGRLEGMNPGDASIQLMKACAAVNAALYEEALPELFRLNYEQPEDVNVKRVLAWGLVGAGKYEQALKHYAGLKENDEKGRADNTYREGVCLWLEGRISDAAECFAGYLRLSYPQATQTDYRRLFHELVVEPEAALLNLHIVRKVDYLLMEDLTLECLILKSRA